MELPVTSYLSSVSAPLELVLVCFGIVNGRAMSVSMLDV